MQPIRLGSNENPLGPSPRAIEAARNALAGSNRYPDASGFYLREALAARHAIPVENIILGNGSTELIDLAARTMLRRGDTGITSQGSFPLYYTAIRSVGARLVEVPLSDYAFDLTAIARNVTPETKLIYLANPNNPTGTMFTADDLDAFLARIPENVLVVLDEAYCDYVDAPNYSRSIDLVRGGKSLLVLRTFSKVYGLAALRIGYGFGPESLLAGMNEIRMPFNTSGVAQAAALAALEDVEHVRRSVESNRAGLAQLRQALDLLGLRSIPSVANFMLIDFGYDTERLCHELLQHGVIVRAMRWMGFPKAIRVSVGTPAENENFLNALAGLLSKTAARQSETHTKGT